MKWMQVVGSSRVLSGVRSSIHEHQLLTGFMLIVILALFGVIIYSSNHRSTSERSIVVSPSSQAVNKSEAIIDVSTQATELGGEVQQSREGHSASRQSTARRNTLSPAVGTLKVNDTVVDIPNNGEVYRQIVTSDGSTRLDLSVSSSSTTGSSSTHQSTLDINLESSSEQMDGSDGLD